MEKIFFGGGGVGGIWGETLLHEVTIFIFSCIQLLFMGETVLKINILGCNGIFVI